MTAQFSPSLIAVALRAVLRRLGLPLHKGWRATHRSGFDIECIGCGERRSMYARPWRLSGGWWETTASGDGSCGKLRELPERW